MHEIGIAAAILEASQVEAARRPGSRLVRVGVRIGVLSGVDGDALRFAFDALTAGTELDTLKFEIQSCLRRNRCEDCGHEFESVFYNTPCPCCANEDSVLIGGDELELTYIEVEEA